MTRSLLNDPHFPQLRQLVDMAQVSVAFAHHLRQTYPAHGFTVKKCQLTKVDYRPAERLRLLYRLWLRDGHGMAHENWFFAKAYPAAVAAEKYESARAKQFPPMDTIWQPVSFLPTLNLIVWAFPYDGRLPHLRELLDMAQTTERIREQAAVLGLPPAVADTLTLDRVRRQLVKYKPAGRCVLRFEVGEVSFYSKTYRGEESGKVFGLLQTLVERDLNGRLAIPRPLCHHTNLHTFWQANWNGRSLAELYRSKQWPTVIPSVAAALAAFHQISLPQLPFTNHVQVAIKEASEDAMWLQQFLPSDATSINHITQRLATIGHTIAATHTIPTVPVHGAFRMSQLLQQGNQLAMIDFDTATQGDPLYDVAELMTSLLFQYFRRRLRIGQLRHKADQFCALYTAQVPWPVDQQRLHWYIAAFLFEKLFGAVKGLREPMMPQLDSYFSLIDYFLQKAAAPMQTRLRDAAL